MAWEEFSHSLGQERTSFDLGQQEQRDALLPSASGSIFGGRHAST
jgi:hypothetical protein